MFSVLIVACSLFIPAIVLCGIFVDEQVSFTVLLGIYQVFIGSVLFFLSSSLF